MTKSIDHLLRETLNSRAPAAPPTPCLDAETAAALADDTLSAHERSGAEAHVAECVRCQALLAALVRMTPPAVGRPWWCRPAIGWLIPLTVAATAAIVWINVPRQPNVEPAVLPAPASAPAAKSDSTQTAPTNTVAELRSEATRHSAAAPVPVARRERYRVPLAKSAPATPPPGALTDSHVVPPPTAFSAPAAETRPADAQLPSARLAGAATAQASAPSVESGSSRAAQAEQPPQPSLAETVTVTTDTSEQMQARRVDAGRQTLIISSNPISRWRIGADGFVHHSADGGSTWRTQSTGVKATLTAGSSPSPSVCWLVGAAGVVLMSTDEGRSWQQLAFPEPIDLISIRATSDKSATVVASDRRTFSTSDGGRSWRR